MTTALTKLWHWLVLAFCVVSIIIAARLGLSAWDIAEETPDDQLIWRVMAGGCGFLVLGFAWETWWRIARLRATAPPETPSVSSTQAKIDPAPELPPTAAPGPAPKRAPKRSGRKRGKSRGSKR